MTEVGALEGLKNQKIKVSSIAPESVKAADAVDLETAEGRFSDLVRGGATFLVYFSFCFFYIADY
jgi:hypothetical protein